MSKQNYKTQSRDAAIVAKRAHEIVEKELDKVKSGKSLKANISIFPESRFPKWATTLATMLCNNPELAKLDNKQLAALIENDDGEVGINHTLFSKKLSAGQLQLVREILLKHGYATDTLHKATDIKRIVKDDLRTETEKDEAIKFYHDSIEIDGRRYKYKVRRNPSGNRIMDLRIRMQGNDIPLGAVLQLRHIGTTKFAIEDERACQFAIHQQMVEQPDQINSTNLKSTNTSGNNESIADRPDYTGTAMFKTMQTWYLNFSPARRQTATFLEFMNGMHSDPKFMKALKSFADGYDEEQREIDKMTVTPGQSNREFISDSCGNLIDISTIRDSNSSRSDYDKKSRAFFDVITTTAYEECLIDDVELEI